MIKINNLNKFYNRGKSNQIHVINDVTLNLPECGMVAIFGKSGCGKTTLLNVIGGLDSFASGSVTVDGKTVKKNYDAQRNKYTGYIFQNYNLNKNESCFENVADALRLCGMTDEDEIKKRVECALKNVGMEKYIKRTPDSLSGGQQQRIAIARAIVKNPKIILADEPTGNLDEANTVMIMDLLKEISKERLVLLVTHEANLVDYYCDTVVELKDGAVVSIKNNDSTSGYTAKNKNHIYLGELTKATLSDENAEIEYYGEVPNEPVRLKIVNSGGKLYVQIDSGNVRLIDSTSEIKLKEGVYEQKVTDSEHKAHIDMTGLPEIEGKHYGRLFSFKSSLKSGYEANFKKQKKSKKLLRNCMVLFSAVIVFMTSVLGTSIKDILDVKDSYNSDIFYVYTKDENASSLLKGALLDEESGIDYISLYSSSPYYTESYQFTVGCFETFSNESGGAEISAKSVLLDVGICKEMKLLEGKKDDIKETELVISSKLADLLLEKSRVDYIKDYEDLIGLVSQNFPRTLLNPSIVGIVEYDQPAIFTTAENTAKIAAGSNSLGIDTEHGMTVNKGQTVVAINGIPDEQTPKEGEKIKIHGVELTVSKVKQRPTSYPEWLISNGIERLEREEYFSKYNFDEGDENYKDKYLEKYLEWCEYYYADIDGFINDFYFFSPDEITPWLYCKKGVTDAKFVYMTDVYYVCSKYKEEHGAYPTYEQYENATKKYNRNNDLDGYIRKYEYEFYRSPSNGFYDMYKYILNKEDYIEISKSVGETHPTVSMYSYGYKYEYEYEYIKSSSVATDAIIGDGMSGYTMIHSVSNQKTERWLKNNFSDLDDKEIVTPDDIFDRQIENKKEDIMQNLISMAVILVLMSVCMYFIMRSSLMNRIKEIGIYRAVGVSKKNLVFRFLIESVVLIMLTVFIGYLASSAFVYACLSLSSAVMSFFYYPLWIALIVLAVLLGVGIVCGILPIMMLLRKTPSAILSKYDI